MLADNTDIRTTISVITICRNAEKTIARALQSVAEQKNVAGQVEHIVVDGASTDATMDIVRQFNHITRSLSEPDQGIADAFNKGMQMATGVYLFYLNADDWLYDDQVLRDALAFIHAKGAPDWIVGDVMTDRTGRLEKAQRSHPPSCWSLMLRNRISHPAVLLKRQILQELGGFDLRFKIAMDFDLWQRLCARQIHPTYWSRVVSVFSMEGISSMQSELQQKERGRIISQFRNSAIKRSVGRIYDVLKGRR